MSEQVLPTIIDRTLSNISSSVCRPAPVYKRAQCLYPHPGQPADREDPQPQLGGGLQKLNNDTSPHVLWQWGENTSMLTNKRWHLSPVSSASPSTWRRATATFSWQISWTRPECKVGSSPSLTVYSQYQGVVVNILMHCIVHNSPPPRYGQVARGHCPRSLHGPGGQAKFRANASARWTVRRF